MFKRYSTADFYRNETVHKKYGMGTEDQGRPKSANGQQLQTPPMTETIAGKQELRAES
jgi:hypothetical protein